MKKLAMLSLICLAGWSVSPANPPHNPGLGVSFGVFYSSLSPYGEWISIDADVYGWRPHRVAAGWRPYMMGRWIWTDDGWYWASDEPWGWAAYHYGRWHDDDYYGWIWIPGYDWAPAWVEWRYGGDYIGWAPLSPYAVFSVTFGVHYRHHWATPHHWWSFVDCGHIASHHVQKYVYRHDDNPRFIGRTRGVGSVRYEQGRIVTRGPDRGYVERRGRVRLDPADIVDVTDRQGERIVRGGNNRERIETYRPRISKSDERSTVERPTSVRKTERPVALEPRNLDVRARKEDLERGRDVRRSEQYRQQQQQMEKPRDQARGPEPNRVVRPNTTRRPGQSIDRTPAPRKESFQQIPRSQERPQLRSREPERTIRRPEGRSNPAPQVAPRSEPRRGNEGARSGGGGGRSGDSGGSRRGGSRK